MIIVIIWEKQIKPSSRSAKPRASQYLLLFHIRYYLKISLDVEQIFEIKKTFFG